TVPGGRTTVSSAATPTVPRATSTVSRRERSQRGPDPLDEGRDTLAAYGGTAPRRHPPGTAQTGRVVRQVLEPDAAVLAAAVAATTAAWAASMAFFAAPAAGTRSVASLIRRRASRRSSRSGATTSSSWHGPLSARRVAVARSSGPSLVAARRVRVRTSACA